MDGFILKLKKISCLLWLAGLCVFYSGCAQTYMYATGEKGELIMRQQIRVFGTIAEVVSEDKHLKEKDEKIFDAIKNLDETVNPDGIEDTFDMLNKGWDNLSGVFYVFKEGERQESILQKAGPPLERKMDKKWKYYEIWEYDFCTMHFRKGKLKKFYKKEKTEKEEKGTVPKKGQVNNFFVL
jgi:hypothetical protein